MSAPAFIISETGRIHPTGVNPCALPTTQTRPYLLVDTYTEDFGASFRAAGDALLARVRLTRPIVLTGIGVRNRLFTDGQVRFVIFDAESGELVFASESQSFGRGEMGEKISTPFAGVVLQPDRVYAIGGIADVDADWGWERGLDVYGDGIQVAGKANENATGFETPVLKPACGSVRVHIQLYGTTTPAVFRVASNRPTSH